LLKHTEGFRSTIDQLVGKYRGVKIDKVAGIESRGFIIGAALAYQLKAGFVPIRKKGKLPGENFGHDYELEYGTDRLEIHTDAIQKGEKVLLVDDLIATGGTAEATVKLIGKTGGQIVGCAFVVDLPDLGGRKRLEKLGQSVVTLCEFEGN
ncbi:MAG: adenine phosphoribosyltransferase, partial [Burkholderiales bacterium]